MENAKLMQMYEKSLHQRIDKVQNEFLNSPYTKQVQLYKLALVFEYYELLSELIKFLPELPEEFLDDVEKLKI